MYCLGVVVKKKEEEVYVKPGVPSEKVILLMFIRLPMFNKKSPNSTNYLCFSSQKNNAIWVNFL